MHDNMVEEGRHKPGLSIIDNLHNAFNEQPDEPLDKERVQEFIDNPVHLHYLNNDAYAQYLKMHKVVLGETGSRQLIGLADELSGAYMPTHLDAAASAYAEVALHDTSLSAVERVNLMNKADSLRQTILERNISLQSEYGSVFSEVETPYRSALDLAYSPIAKSIITGNVTDSVRKRVFHDSAFLGKIVSNELERYYSVDCRREAAALTGLLHEINALNTMLYLDDPRYLPMPSGARADSGYYHPEQTHDIVLINQHWGNIKKVIPVEIKAKASRRDRSRYKALLIRGKMHLAIDGSNLQDTAEAFFEYANDKATVYQTASIDRMSTEVREMLRLYQQGMTPERLAVNSVTRFYNSNTLNRLHPEIAQTS